MATSASLAPSARLSAGDSENGFSIASSLTMPALGWIA
jgi:hypothetical protein